MDSRVQVEYRFDIPERGLEKEEYMLNGQKKYLSLVILLTLLLSLAGALVMAQKEGVYVQYRQMIMRSQAARIGMIGTILGGNLPFKGHIAVHAKAIERNAGLMPEAFKKKAMEGETRAMVEIWKNWDKFVALAAANEKESAALAAIALSGDPAAILAQMKKVGDTCGRCHFSFRYP